MRSHHRLAAIDRCAAASGERRVPLLELYTSEGCDSCPPVDAWLSTLRGKGYGSDKVVPVAFHVDYWDYIGWRDPFAQARFSARQRSANARIGSRTIYTPQLMLNGRDFRGAAARDQLGTRLAEVNTAPARATIRLMLKPAAGELAVAGAWRARPGDDPAGAQGWIALYENRLANDVRAGENRGRRLQHDFVVRDLAGPFAAGELKHNFSLDARWKRADLGIAAFVQDAKTGETWQALGIEGCNGPA